jgi:hypothetical protein
VVTLRLGMNRERWFQETGRQGTGNLKKRDLEIVDWFLRTHRVNIQENQQESSQGIQYIRRSSERWETELREVKKCQSR